MKRKMITLAVLSTLTLGTALTGCNDDNDKAKIVSVEFVETMAAPDTAETMSQNMITAKAVVKYSDGTTKDYPLSYHTLFGVNDKVGGNAHPAGQLYDYQMNPLTDPYGQPLIAETPDANSLLNVEGNLWLVSHLEYDWLLSDGAEAWKTAGWYSRAPMGMILTGLTQADDGKLSVKSQRSIDFSSVNGSWINCFGSQTPWNTHLGSEEDYDLQYNPLSSSYGTTTAGVKAMTELYWKNSKTANPYHYGWIPEVTVAKDGKTSVAKHYSMGRGTWEQAYVMADSKTALLGDDGTQVLLTMYVADKAKDLSAGTLYAAKWNQTSSAGAGAANLTWFKLGHATDAEVKALIDGGATFETIWSAVAPTTADDGSKSCAAGYTRVRAGSSSDECLMLKSGMEKAAAFLETRRYAAYLGATTEFNKMEGIAFNQKDNKAYIAMSYIDRGMKADATAPADHIQVAKLNAGATYTMDLTSGQKTINGGEAINSNHVPTKIYAEAGLTGEDIAVDAFGNTANPNKIANTDNVFFSEKMRTLFIGEDSGTHVNNYVWAYNVDTKKLTRIMSAVAGAENTGLQVIDNLNGKGAYIMGNTQHWSDFPGTVPAELAAQLVAKIGNGVNQGGFGYIGGLPAIK
jgi:secreted PhoX family phosphatase